MTKMQKAWYSWGVSDALAYPQDHPEQLFQEAWSVFLTDTQEGHTTWSEIIELFPSYKKGILKTTKYYENW
jgi:hypothetical protein